ncbi:MAG: hypothetical protein NZ580_05280 [Bacteroidia bacterium]|nr:hypothetical protein [Bacteroidia bacterium]MDW8236281.1 hypothetical protein [Bacteroidia bacterium]
MAQLTDSPIARARLAAWIVLAAQVVNATPIILNYHKSPQDLSLQLDLTIFGIALLVHTLVTIGLYVSKALFLRMMLVFTTTFALTLEGILHDPLEKGVVWWSVTVSFILVSLIMSPKELRYGYFVTGTITLFSILLIILRPYLPHYPQNAFNKDLIRLIFVTIGMGVGGSILVQRVAQLTAQMMEQQRMVIAELQQKKAEAEAALRQIEELRREEQKRAETEQFLSRYEVLMRTGYQQSLEEFYQSLLDALCQEVSVMKAALYRQVATDEWEVVATWGALDNKGKVVDSYFLQTVASLRRMRWISLSAEDASPPPTSFSVLKPRGVLYLPFFDDAQKRTVAIAELILGEETTSEQVEKMSFLLPRVGTYLAIRMQQTALT